MTNKQFKKIILSSVIAGLLSYPTHSYADDSEVYFGDSSGIKSNVLFVLDISGSMSSGEESISGSLKRLNLTDNFRRINILKDSLQKIINSPDVKDLRIGVMTFNTYKYGAAVTSILIPQPIVDIDEVDPTKEMAITNASNGVDKVITQRIVSPADNLIQRTIAAAGATADPTPYAAIPDFEPAIRNPLTMYTGVSTIGLRFTNILVKKPSSVGASAAAVKKATLRFYNNSAVPRPVNIRIYAEPVDDSAYIIPYFNALSDKIDTTKYSKIEFQDCQLAVKPSYQWTECSVTELMQRLTSSDDWKDGNSITLIIQSADKVTTAPMAIRSNYDNSAIDVENSAKLLIEVEPKLVAKNKMTKRSSILDTAMKFTPNGGTPIVDALMFASTYVSNIDKGSINPYDNTTAGPYHGSKLPAEYNKVAMPETPINNSCQLTHLVLMTDGQATVGKGAQTVPRYTGAKTCRIFTNEGSDPTKWKDDSIADPVPESYYNNGEACGRSLVSWMARTSHSSAKATATEMDGNYIYTQTIGLALAANGAPQKFLNELAKYGKGNSYNTKDTSELTAAFKNIITNAMNVTKPSASGSVGQSSRSNYEQRNEAFFSLFKVQPTDYWAGNVKGFKLKYVKTTIDGDKDGEQAVLYDWNENLPALDSTGSFQNVSTAWSTGLEDGNDVDKGGVAERLPAPTARNKMYTKNMEAITASSVSASDFALTGTKATADYATALINFMKGYKFNAPATPAKPLTPQSPKKLGDSTNNGLTLVAYGCSGEGANLNITNCPFNNLSMVGLIATNDGFIRGYNLKDGTPLYEFIPKEMLPKVDVLANPKGLNKEQIRTYGLDSRIVVYHDDANGNSYIDNGEKAYAIVSSGRGGPYIYILDISNQNNINLIATITNTGDFSKLGNTWSTPITGNVKIDATTYPVAIIGGGYNPQQDNTEQQKADTIGNIIYVINLIDGTRLASFDAGMNYSVPGELSVLTDENLITDIVYGDMGGQLWRLKVNNGKAADNLLTGAGGTNGLIASLSGSSKEDTRRFYQKPMLYNIDKTTLSINIGSGYKAHPLVKYNNDRFYSIRVPLDASNDKVITETDLAVADPKNVTNGLSNIEHGFRVNLGTVTGTLATGDPKGEKVISNAFADMGRLIFNTYIPDTDASRKSCSPAVGTQRTYYFNIVNGTSLFKSGFKEISPSTLPLDIATYCGKNYCTIVTSINDLSGKELLQDQFFKKPGNTRVARKLNWTDLFDPET